MLAWSGWRDCTGFLFSGSVVVGAVRLKWWGLVWLSFHFLYFAVSSLGVRLSVVGFLFFYLDFLFGYILLRFAGVFISC